MSTGSDAATVWTRAGERSVEECDRIVFYYPDQDNIVYFRKESILFGLETVFTDVVATDPLLGSDVPDEPLVSVLTDEEFARVRPIIEADGRVIAHADAAVDGLASYHFASDAWVYTLARLHEWSPDALALEALRSMRELTEPNIHLINTLGVAHDVGIRPLSDGGSLHTPLS